MRARASLLAPDWDSLERSVAFLVMAEHDIIASGLATAFLLDEFEVDALVQRGARLLGKRWRWLRPLAELVTAQFRGPTRPRHSDVAMLLAQSRILLRALGRHDVAIQEWPLAAAAFLPAPAAIAWRVPQLTSLGELADWLGVPLRELDWFADQCGLQSHVESERLRHYRYRLLTKRLGGARLIEAPKPRLKSIQRRILAEILDRVPAHGAAHGFRPGRSIKTFAAPHVGRRVVLKIDLCDFFPTFRASRINSLFRTIGYPEAVAHALAGLCLNAAPESAWRTDGLVRDEELGLRRLYGRQHLPQGAPTSPALANLGAYRLDCRLQGLARAAGASYTRYADDLAFSGDEDFARIVHRFRHYVGATILEEGFRPNFRKTRITRAGARQRLAGLVVNERLNVERAEFDRLKSILTNCRRHGPNSQDREGHSDFRAHLAGKVAFVESIHAARGRKLRDLFNRIAW